MNELVWRHPDSRALLRQVLADGAQAGRVASEDWYRSPEKWYASRTQRRPYRFEYKEDPILDDNESQIRERVVGRLLVFLGVGVAESELKNR